MIQVRWSRDAQVDLATLDDEFRRDDPDYARRIGARAIKACGFLADNPAAGPTVSRTRLRKWRVARTPYLLLYRLEEDRLLIVRLVHAARDFRRFV